MAIIVMVLLGILMAGCSALQCSYLGACQQYYEEQLDKGEIRWNQWLGKPKDEYIKKMALRRLEWVNERA